MSKFDLKSVVSILSKKYNFEVEEALRMLNVEKKEKQEKSKYPLPFNGEKKEGYCNGVVKNHGLYTQCPKKVKEGSYCKGCVDEPYGNIDDRVKVGLYEYKDPKGKGPKRYTEVLKKLNISKETIEEEAKRLNITIPPVHFEEVNENVKRGRPKSEKKVKEVTGKKGRPKKERKQVEVKDVEEEDLFATLIANANAKANQVLDQPLDQPLEKVEPKEDESNVLAPPVVEKVEKKSKKVKETDPAKEAEKQKKAEEKAAKEAEKQKKADEKAAKEAEKEIEKQKKAEEKAAKEAEKQKKADEKAAKALAPPLPKVEEEAADVVRKFEHEGKSYYKSKNSGVIYNMEQEVVGKWNAERNAIDFEEEEEEEEYDD
jgi:chemotaxis protein histidine kinase CheA